MTKRTNPRRVPATQADVERARSAGRDEGFRFAQIILYTVLWDKEHADAEIMQRVWREGEELADSVAKGYVSIPDLLRTLREEYGVDIIARAMAEQWAGPETITEEEDTCR